MRGTKMLKEKKEPEIVKELDTTGLFCPEPLFQLRELSEKVEIGQCFKVVADDPAAEEDFKRWAKRVTDFEIIDFVKNGNLLSFTFRKKNDGGE
ncbi:MAG: Sulfurtransferase TusA [Promethearchaeota archaeon]|nr:MAG: Sulfurtransferase TusA [Candidatus Lokiarchaeota archaeon]